MTLLDPEQLVGAPFDSPEVVGFLVGCGPPRRDEFAEIEIVEYPEKGVAIYVDGKRRVVSVFLYGIQTEGHARYDGPMPRSVSFDDGMVEVLKRLGRPSISGRAKESGSSWDRFDFPNVSIHFQYSMGTEAVEMVTLMTPGMARGEV